LDIPGIEQRTAHGQLITKRIVTAVVRSASSPGPNGRQLHVQRVRYLSVERRERIGHLVLSEIVNVRAVERFRQ
jgi:hypothetical protein